MTAIFKRELMAYFKSSIGYIFIGMFLVVSGFMFTANNLLMGSPHLDGVLSNLLIVFLFLVPVLTMRLLSEERNLKTDQILLTSPVSVWDIVLGKYFAAAVVYLITLGITLLYLIVIAIHGEPAYAQIFCNYFGFALLGMSFISIGTFISSLTENQASAAVSTFAVLLLLFILDWVAGSVTNPFFVRVIDFISIMKRFGDFQLGVLSLAPTIYYISFIAMFLVLTALVMERRRIN